MSIYQIILSAIFIIAGSFKLMSAKPIKDQFEEFGLPKYVMISVGIIEVLGGIGLQFLNIHLYATIGLTILMLGAIINHIKVNHKITQTIPSFILLIALVIYLYLNV